MKMFSRRSVIVLLFFQIATSALASLPGPDIIRECSSCGAQILQETMLSGNTFGATFWTDGWRQAPMLPDYPLLVKCPKCGKLLWIEEAKEIGEREWGRQDEWPDAAKPKSPTESDLISLISKGKLTAEKELYARRRAWWAANHPIRENPEKKEKLSLAQEDNLQAMARLLDVNDPDDRITKAEIFRELGRFDDCIQLLGKPFDSDGYSQVAVFIRNLAEKESRTVSQINFEDKSAKQDSDTTR